MECHFLGGCVNNYPQCSCICVSVGNTVVFACIVIYDLCVHRLSRFPSYHNPQDVDEEGEEVELQRHMRQTFVEK
jgi:hypothetical protein